MHLSSWKIGLFSIAALAVAGGADCGGGSTLPFPKTAFWTTRIVDDAANVRPAAVAIADFDGDGRLDVVVGFPGTGIGAGAITAAVTIFFQTDVDNFTAVQLTASDDLFGLAGLAVADMDADGHSDLIAACNGRLVYLHSPVDPRIAAGWTMSTIDGSTGADVNQWNDVAVGAIDALNGPDIVACNENVGRVSWFQSPADLSTGTGWTRIDIDATTRSGAAAVLLVNVDGGASRLDIISTAPGEAAARVAWYQNPTDPATDAWTKSEIGNLTAAGRMAMGDLDGDGRDDLVVTNPTDRQIGWYKNPRDPTALWPGYLITQYSSNTPTDVQVADIDGNSQLDVVVATENGGTLRWFTPIGSQLLQWGENNLQDLTVSAGRIAIGDLDADNRPDVAAAALGATTDLDAVLWFENPEP